MYEDFHKFWQKKWLTPKFLKNNKLLLKVLEYNKKPKNKKILDLWCWPWRDSVIFDEKWFLVDSFDFSSNALAFLEKYINESKLNIKTILWDMFLYDFWENYYDVIYSCNSLHYYDKENTKIVFEKIKKSLKKWWYFFLRVKSTKDIDFWKWEKISENFYKNWDDIKHYFEIDFLKELFYDFEILEIYETFDEHQKISGEITINWFIDLVSKK